MNKADIEQFAKTKHRAELGARRLVSELPPDIASEWEGYLQISKGSLDETADYLARWLVKHLGSNDSPKVNGTAYGVRVIGKEVKALCRLNGRFWADAVLQDVSMDTGRKHGYRPATTGEKIDFVNSFRTLIARDPGLKAAFAKTRARAFQLAKAQGRSL